MRTERAVFHQPEAELKLPPEVANKFQIFAENIMARSSIIWGEHCSECALPACYSTCSYYSPRADLTCRRFVAGIEPIAATGQERLYRIRFRKWGKLEGGGPAPVRPAAKAQAADFFDSAVSRLIASIPQPFRLKHHLLWRWNSYRKHGVCHTEVWDQHAFVIESCSADGLTHPFTVTFLGKDGHSIYQERFAIAPSYSRLEIPARNIVRNVDLTAPYLVQIEPSGESAGCDVVLGIADFVVSASTAPERQAAAPSKSGTKKAKVVVWDLDNTVWDGILAEDGIEDIRLRPKVAEVIVELDRRGILHSIASKNDHAAAMQALERFKLNHYFLCPQIGWHPKSDSVHRIAQTLDLGIDSFVFVDDQAFERGEVQQTHPSITVITDAEAASLPSHPLCDVAATAESKSRRAMYQAEALRVAKFQASKTSYLDFLKSCNIVLEVTALKQADCERIYELSQRTNQLNFFGTKYSRDDVAALRSEGGGFRTFVLRCSDKFGEYGVIGFAVIDFSAAVLIDFFMSCRVQRKHVENAFFAAVAAQLQSAGHTRLSARVRKTVRNEASFQMLQELGFTVSEEPDRWERNLTHEFGNSDTVRLQMEPPAALANGAGRTKSEALVCTS